MRQYPAVSQPVVSIITPVFNRADYLAETIESVLAQTLGEWELIIIDDGSDDDRARNIAASYQARDLRIRYAYQQHGGISAARNHGISLARGRYLAFLDSDDRYLPEGLMILLSVLRSGGRQLKLVYANFIKYFQAEDRYRLTRVTPPRSRPGLYFQYLIPGGNPVAPCACLLERKALDVIGSFDSRFDSIEDRELWSRLVRCYDVAHVETPVAIYRKHEHQVSRQRAVRRLANDRQFHTFFCSMPMSHWFPEAVGAEAQAKALDDLARIILGRPDPPLDSALSLLRLAQQRSPMPRRQAFITDLEVKIPRILRAVYACEDRITTTP